MAECGGPSALQSLAAAVGGGGGQFSFLQERWAPVSNSVLASAAGPLVSGEELQSCLRSFIGASLSGQALTLPPGVGSLAPQDAQKFLSRAADLSRHICARAPPQVVQHNLAALAQHLHVSAGPAQPQQGALEEGWNAGSHQAAFDSAWNSTQTGSAWAAEFAPRAAVLPALAGPAPGSMERAWSQVTAPAATQNLEQAWQQSVAPAAAATTGESWAQEFTESFRPEAQSWTEEYAAQEDEREEGAVSEFRGYHFAPAHANPFFGNPRALEKGRQLYAEGKSADAVLAFEAALQKDSTNAEAWRLLGSAHADCDDDAQAISALSVAQTLQPGETETLMSLAVSLANELHKDQAVDTLREWISMHPAYRGLQTPQALPGSDSLARVAQVTALFDQAAAMRPIPADADPDVHTALGLLHNISYEFGKAADHFRLAIARKPMDHQLWNKLGATLANDNNSQEATDAYRMALRLRPGYMRAHSNLGIAMIAQGDAQEAAREFLRALELDPSADHMWDNLSLAFKVMRRDDLVEKVGLKDVDFFRSILDF